MAKTIMDVSRHQGVIDWAKVKASGKIDGVMLRAMGNSAEGKPSAPYTDPQFARNYAECKRLGIPCGVYGYFKATTRAEADKELAYFKKLLTGKTFELPVAVDIEDKAQQALGKTALTDLVAYMLGVVQSWGVYAMLYTGLWFGQTFLSMGGTALKPYDVWLAAYRGKKPAPGWLALVLMLGGLAFYVLGAIRLGYGASVKPLVLDLIERAEHEIQGTKRGAERKAWVAAKLRTALDASKFGRLFSWAITDETIGRVIQFFFDRAKAAVGKQ